MIAMDNCRFIDDFPSYKLPFTRDHPWPCYQYPESRWLAQAGSDFHDPTTRRPALPARLWGHGVLEYVSLFCSYAGLGTWRGREPGRWVLHASTWEELKCGFDIDCPQYSECGEAEGQEQLKKRNLHNGWPGLYLRWMVLHSQTLISKNQYVVDKDYFLPLFHAVFDEVLAKAI